jgi:hypothetical protein
MAILHLALDALNRTAVNTALGGNLQRTLAGPQLILDALFNGIDPWPAELCLKDPKGRFRAWVAPVRNALRLKAGSS